jgi:transposase InsO family protein
MSLRRTIIECDPSTFNVTRFCQDHGVSTWFFWDLRRRHRVEGEAVLAPKSRAAHTVANKTPAEVEEAIVRTRKELVDAGWDAGPATIAFHLRDLPGVPHEATIWRILKARGLVIDDPSKAPKAARRSFTAERANDCWQLDDTGWQLADGTEVEILNVLDDHSRLAVASQALPVCTGAATFAVLAAIAAVIGWPARFLSDNATPFRHVLADALGRLGVAAGHSRPYHPQTCGKVERFHQTLKRWLCAQPPRPRSNSCKRSSTCSASSTTITAPTVPSPAATPPTYGPTPPRAAPPPSPSTPPPPSTTAPCTAARSPSATATGSPSAPATPANEHSPSSPAPPATCSSTAATSGVSPSTPPDEPSHSTPAPLP